MSLVARRSLAASFLLAAAVAPLAQAHAAECVGGAAGALAVGQAVRVEPGPARSYAIDLAAGQGLIVDLSSLAPPAPKSANADDADAATEAKSVPRNLLLCDAKGGVLVPLAGEVFEKGSSVASTSDGQRLRFVAPVTGRYNVWLAASGDAREILARNRDLGKLGGVTAVRLGGEVEGSIAAATPQLFTFAGTAGQWVELKATSDSDTVLHLAGPDRSGAYAEIASNDDSDGLNPRIRRRLPVTATYYAQLVSLTDDADSYALSVKLIAAPPPPPAPVALQMGAAVQDKLSNADDARLYTLSVVAGHSYRLELTADYDGVVAIGLPNPVEAEDAKDGPAAGFSEIKAQDSGTTGTERLNFTARTGGQLQVLVRSFGIGESDGSYRLVATDLGG